jgi:transcription elongation GreA/GreB family factor
MNVEQLRKLAQVRDVSSLESGWLEAIETAAPVSELAGVLDAASAAGLAELAATLAVMLLDERAAAAPPAEALDMAKALLLAAPTSEELRKRTVELYKTVHGARPHFAAFLRASGLEGSQSPRRAVRTLDVSMAVAEGMYLANRFDSRVLRAKGFQDTLGEFELIGPDGKLVRMEPKALCDEFEIVSDMDFRVLCQHRPEQLKDMLMANPAAVLVGLCQTAGGRIDAGALKDRLTPRYIAPGDWADWWSKARAAAKRSGQLSVEGRSPVVIVYHPQGRTLEEELAPTAAAAKGPLDRLAVLRQYAREAKARKVPLKPEFTTPLIEALAADADAYRDKRPADALAAELALQTAADAGWGAPAAARSALSDLIAQAARPAELIAAVADRDLWPSALDAMAARPDAPEQLEAIWPLAPADELDAIAARLLAAGRGQAVERFVSEAMADPVNHLPTCLWMWRGPDTPPANMPRRIELLTRLLGAMNDLDRSWESCDPAVRKAFCQDVRSALRGSGLAGFRAAVAEMDEHVAATVKRLIERTDGLAQAVQEDMLGVLRENFFVLFAPRKIEPWLDEGAVYTTQAALSRQQDEFKNLTEVKMLENARAIGAAAAHGDLSENSEWKFALEERDMLRARAAKMQDELSRARVIRPEDVPTDSVGIGSRVRLVRVDNGSTVELTFLGPWDTDLPRNVYSYKTQLAQDLMGKPVGEAVTLKLDSEEARYRIDAVTPAV